MRFIQLAIIIRSRFIILTRFISHVQLGKYLNTSEGENWKPSSNQSTQLGVFYLGFNDLLVDWS